MIYWKNYDWNRAVKYFKEDGTYSKKQKEFVDDDISIDESENYDTPSEESEKSNVVKYSNTIFTLDTESTSYFIDESGKKFVFDNKKNSKFYEKCKKQAVAYIWMFGINEDVLYGRELSELKELYSKVCEIFKDCVCIIYIHNLSWDFQFLLNAFEYTDMKVFCRKRHKVMKANWHQFEFRCSYFLTNMSLETFAKSYHLKNRKLVDDLEYNVMRTPLTELSEKELDYCEADIKVLFELVEYHKKIYKSVYSIPLTQTGKVRKQVNHLFFKEKKYHTDIHNMQFQTVEEYERLCQAYMGGYTHSNAKFSSTEGHEQVVKNVLSYDITSSYPFVMCVEKFPMTQFCESTMTLDEIDTDKDAFIIDFTAFGIECQKEMTFLSVSKALDYGSTYKIIDGKKQEVKTKKPQTKSIGKIIKGKQKKTQKKKQSNEYLYELDNGRIRKMGFARYQLTDVDFDLFLQFYSIKDIRINQIWVARKDYLPGAFIKYILKLYQQKTQLKGVQGQEALYQQQKELLNCGYGMMATRTISDLVGFDVTGEWFKFPLSSSKEYCQKLIDKQKKTVQNLNFAWALWVSAYGRKHLLDIALKLDEFSAELYCDTDSHKIRLSEILSEEKVEKIFEEDTKEVIEKIKRVCAHYKKEGLTFEMFNPVDIKGKHHLLGEYTKEHSILYFKTFGAKRYACQYFETKEEHEADKKKRIAKINEKIENADDNMKQILKDEIEAIKEEPFVNLTVAGLNKKKASKTLNSIEDFHFGRFFDYDETGKSIAYYNSNQEEVVFEDGYVCNQRFGICLMPTTYYLDMTEDYYDLISDLLM